MISCVLNSSDLYQCKHNGDESDQCVDGGDAMTDVAASCRVS
jgi:hypothetical protein